MVRSSAAEMAAPPKLGSFRETFAQRSKERLLLSSQKGGAEWGSFGFNADDGAHRGLVWRTCRWIGGAWRRLSEFAVSAWEFGRADRRKVVFGAKVGLALTIISLLVFIKGPFQELNRYSVWAILTVVVVFEFSVGKEKLFTVITCTTVFRLRTIPFDVHRYRACRLVSRFCTNAIEMMSSCLS